MKDIPQITEGLLMQNQVSEVETASQERVDYIDMHHVVALIMVITIHVSAYFFSVPQSVQKHG